MHPLDLVMDEPIPNADGHRSRVDEEKEELHLTTKNRTGMANTHNLGEGR